MARCNAWYGEKDSYYSAHYRCQRQKRHKGEHYCRIYPFRVYWKLDERAYFLLNRRIRTLVKREMKDVPISTEKERLIYLEIEKTLCKQYDEKYEISHWRGWLMGNRSNGES